MNGKILDEVIEADKFAVVFFRSVDLEMLRQARNEVKKIHGIEIDLIHCVPLSLR